MENQITENKAEITYISVDKLHPHENNPRKDLGDLTELADSIKANGIFQNLTVVPCTGHYYGDYTIIIGHRRLAAAKKAGLTEVPCVIVEMNAKEQIATMLLENMQRSDLTVYEQAQGMQMMLDLGETVESISEKTGFSQSTVRCRVRIATLDGDKVKEAQGRQINITDFDKLFEIEDADKRDKLLDKIGTSNFEWELKRAAEDERRKKEQEEIINKLCGRAENISDTDGLKWVNSINSANEIPEFIDGCDYYYKTFSGGWVSLYRTYTDEEITASDKEAADKQRREEEDTVRARQLEEAFKRAFEMRLEFAKNFSDFKGKENVICEMAINAIIKANTSWHNEISEDVFNKVMDTQLDTPFSFDKISSAVDLKTKTLFALAYSIFENKSIHCYDYNLKYCGNSDINTVYHYLEKLGYEMSDEEKALRDGTHELYKSEEE